jgi:hypothetical protein
VAGELQGWQADPFELHEQRWFSEGKPTGLFRDALVEGRGPMPTSEPSPGPQDRAGDVSTQRSLETEVVPTATAGQVIAEPSLDVPVPTGHRTPMTITTKVLIGEVAVLVIALIAALTVSGSRNTPQDASTNHDKVVVVHSTTSTTLQQPQSSTSTTRAESTTTTHPLTVAAWDTKYRSTAVFTLLSDLSSFDNAIISDPNGAGVTAAAKMASDVRASQALPPIPNPEAEEYWSTELADLADAAAQVTQNVTGSSQDGGSGGLLEDIDGATMVAEELVGLLNRIDPI